MSENVRSRKTKKRSRDSSTSSSSERNKKNTKPRKKKKKRERSTSSSSSNDDRKKHNRDSSSSGDERRRKKKERKKKKKRKKEKKKLAKSKNKDSGAKNLSNEKMVGEVNTLKIYHDVTLPTSSATIVHAPKVPLKSMVPMTREEYEKQQSVVRRVFDPQTGRNRLVKGDGEIMEEIVSFNRHKEINKHATAMDGKCFSASIGL